MNLVPMIILTAIIALFLGFYYFSLIISIAIWFPHHARPKWIALVESPAIDAFRWFWKWIAPAWLVTVTVAIAFIAIRLASVL